MVHVLPLVQPFMPHTRESGQCAQQSFTSKVTSKQAGSLEKIRSKQGSNLSCGFCKTGIAGSKYDPRWKSKSKWSYNAQVVCEWSTGPRGCEKGDEKTWSVEAAEIVGSVRFCWSYALWNYLPAVWLYIKLSAADRWRNRKAVQKPQRKACEQLQLKELPHCSDTSFSCAVLHCQYTFKIYTYL